MGTPHIRNILLASYFLFLSFTVCLFLFQNRKKVRRMKNRKLEYIFPYFLKVLLLLSGEYIHVTIQCAFASHPCQIIIV
jgi:hypothetical protein